MKSSLIGIHYYGFIDMEMESLADSDNLPPPDVIAQEIVEDLEAALEQFRLIAVDLGADAAQYA